MNKQTLSTLAYGAVVARWGLGVVGTWLVQRGVITSAQVPETVGAGMALIGLGWAAYHHYTADKKLKITKDALKEARK